MYTIETNRVGLREWQESDLVPFIAMNKDPLVMKHFPSTLTEEQTKAFVERINKHFDEHGFGLFAVELKQHGSFIGFVGLAIPRFSADFTPCVEIGWRLASSHWGKGYAQEAASACLDYGFNQLDLKEIVSFTSILNSNSINVMKRIGMHYVKEFDHPNVEQGHILRKHVLYAKRRKE